MTLRSFVAVILAATTAVGDSTQPCACVDILKKTGVAMATPGGGDTKYTVAAQLDYAFLPADYGASCKKHEEMGSKSCYNLTTGIEHPDGTRADWCDRKWCWVDPCTCNLTDVDGGPSTYFLNPKGVPPQVIYSYSNCEGDVTDPAIFGHASIDKVALCGRACQCVALPATVPTKANGMKVAEKLQFASLPKTYGDHCGKHAETGSADCYNLTTGVELPDGVRKDWCDAEWCMVDPCTCKMSDVAGGISTYFESEDGTPIIVAYSYDNCKAGSNVDTDMWHASKFDKVAYCDGALTCDAVKKFYKSKECCGMPVKPVEKPTWR